MRLPPLAVIIDMGPRARDVKEKEEKEEKQPFRQRIALSCGTANRRRRLLPPGPALKRGLIWFLPENLPEAVAGDDPICSCTSTLICDIRVPPFSVCVLSFGGPTPHGRRLLGCPCQNGGRIEILGSGPYL